MPILESAVDPDGDPIWITEAVSRSGTSVDILTNQSILFRPDTSFTGRDTITYTVTDNRGGFSEGLIYILEVATYDKDKSEVTIDVGNVVSSDSLTLTMQVKNTGSGSDLILRNPESRASYIPFFGQPPKALAVVPILEADTVVIPPGETGQYEVVVSPPEASGPFSAQIEIKTNVDISLYYFSPLLIKVNGINGRTERTEVISNTTAEDFDGDGSVGFSDFILFTKAFGGKDVRFDLNNNGSVDFSDFLMFATAFGS